MNKNIIKDFNYPKQGIENQILLNSGGGKAILYLIAKGGELKPHKASADVLVVIQEGVATITIEGETFEAPQGTTVVFKKDQVHALKANESFKMLLIK